MQNKLELSQIAASLTSDYGKGTWCPDDKKEICKQLDALERILASSRDPQEMLRVWQGWHAIGKPMRGRYTALQNLGIRSARPGIRRCWRDVAFELRDDAGRIL